MNKRGLLFSFITAIAMMMLCPQGAWANWTYSDNWSETITDGTNTIDVSLSGTELTISNNSLSTIKELGDVDLTKPITDASDPTKTYTITALDQSAFAGLTLNSLKLPSTLKTIGIDAFKECTIKNGSLTIPASVTSIGDGALGKVSVSSFEVESGNANYCTSDGIVYDAKMEMVLACPVNKTGSVVLPNTVKYIGDYAFSGSDLKAVTLPASLQTIGVGAFQNSAITSMTIPANVSGMGTYVFAGCLYLKSITVAANNKSFCSIDGILYTYDMKHLLQCPQGYESTSVTIPEGVVYIEAEAFKNVHNLASVVLPSTLKNIYNSAFNDAENLATIICNATTPPTLASSLAFVGIDDDAIVIVPSASISAYKAANYWKDMTITSTDLPTVILNDAGFATYSSSCSADITTDGVEAYFATIDGNNIVLESVGAEIPFDRGLVLYGTPGTTVTFKASSTDYLVIDDNNLKPTTTSSIALVSKSSVSGTIWALGPGASFMQYTGSAFIANRAYLVHEMNSGAKEMNIVFADDTDGINSVENGKLKIENSAAYNALGQRVNNGTKGFVIKNGKKYFVK